MKWRRRVRTGCAEASRVVELTRTVARMALFELMHALKGVVGHAHVHR